jgi:hypothetical protein
VWRVELKGVFGVVIGKPSRINDYEVVLGGVALIFVSVCIPLRLPKGLVLDVTVLGVRSFC